MDLVVFLVDFHEFCLNQVFCVFIREEDYQICVV